MKPLTRRGTAWLWALALGPAALVVLGAAIQPWVRPSRLFKDPLTAVGAHDLALYGLVSNLGILLWCATSSVCLFAALVLRREGNDPGRQRFLVATAGLTALLLLDDLFLGHEVVLPAVLPLSEKTIYLVYVALTLGYLIGFRRRILSSQPALLLVSLSLFAISVAIDVTFDSSEWKSIGEDGAKFLGIASWSAFHLRLAWQSLTSRSVA